MISVAVVASDSPKELIEALSLAGATALPVDDPATAQTDEWAAALVDLRTEPLLSLREAHRIRDDVGCPLIALIGISQTGLLESETWIDDFVTEPIDPLELKLRLHRLTAQPDAAETLNYKSLELNLATYQATIEGHPVDLTYMEYELLRYFIEHQGRVWSREQLLQNVWGYDYFGGARTVDVHVRRLRAKLGEERASWITTVRSVGYRFG